MEVLSQEIQGVVDTGKWKGIKVTRERIKVSHLFFADDLILFGEASRSQAKLMKAILRDICEVSGQKINTSKSKLYTSQDNSVLNDVIVSSNILSNTHVLY